MPHNAKNPDSILLCAVLIGPATPHIALSDSRIVQTTTQNRSTDPKKSGARTSTTIVVQSWMDLNVTSQNPDFHRCYSWFPTFSSVL